MTGVDFLRSKGIPITKGISIEKFLLSRNVPLPDLVFDPICLDPEGGLPCFLHETKETNNLLPGCSLFFDEGSETKIRGGGFYEHARIHSRGGALQDERPLPPDRDSRY